MLEMDICKNCGEKCVSANQVELSNGVMGCFVCKPDNNMNTQVSELHVKAGNKYEPTMTVAMKNRVINRRMMPNGTSHIDRRYR